MWPHVVKKLTQTFCHCVILLVDEPPADGSFAVQIHPPIGCLDS
jgi:hypothetical protein